MRPSFYPVKQSVPKLTQTWKHNPGIRAQEATIGNPNRVQSL